MRYHGNDMSSIESLPLKHIFTKAISLRTFRKCTIHLIYLFNGPTQCSELGLMSRHNKKSTGQVHLAVGFLFVCSTSESCLYTFGHRQTGLSADQNVEKMGGAGYTSDPQFLVQNKCNNSTFDHQSILRKDHGNSKNCLK